VNGVLRGTSQIQIFGRFSELVELRKEKVGSKGGKDSLVSLPPVLRGP